MDDAAFDTNQALRPKFSIGRLLIVCSGLVLMLSMCLLFFAHSRQETSVNHANYALISPGMSEAGLRRLLGPPGYSQKQLGQITSPEGPNSYTTNLSASPATLRKRGFEDTHYLQWTSPEITISVVLDSSGKVATRYSSEGQSVNILHHAVLWIHRRL